MKNYLPPKLTLLRHDGIYSWDIGERSLLYIVDSGHSYVTQRLCPHASFDLMDGELVAHRLICPQHSFKFNLKDGRESSGLEYCLRSYTIQEDEHGSYVEL